MLDELQPFLARDFRPEWKMMVSGLAALKSKTIRKLEAGLSTRLETALAKIPRATFRWDDAAWGKAEIIMPDGHMEAFSASRQQADDDEFVRRKLAMLGFGEKLPNTLG